MPIRAISGYFVGQTTPSIFLIFFALFNLRKQLGQEVKAEAYWKSDRYPILKYAFPVAVFVSVGTLQTLVETFVIRHRLPSLDSAGYYVISRFAEIGGYVGLTLVFVLFPLAAESHEKGGRSCRMLWHSIVGAFVSGVLLSSLLWARGEWLLSVIPTWQEYAVYNSQMAVLAMVFTLRSVGACFVNFEMACGRFGFVCYFAGIAGLESVLLYGLTGYSFFEERVPSFWITWAERLNACRLDFVIQVMFVSSCLTAVCALLHEVMRHLPRRVTVPHVDVKFE
jgi:O-antigen/teichoic acid export membrane protein